MENELEKIKTQIPIYRAKYKYSDKYVLGTYLKDSKSDVMITHSRTDLDRTNGMYVNCIEIEPKTLAIHFPDMLDSQVNKIFASLSNDGKGGDIIVENNSKGIVMLENGRCMINWIKNQDYFSRDLCNHNINSRIIGIQQ